VQPRLEHGQIIYQQRAVCPECRGIGNAEELTQIPILCFIQFDEPITSFEREDRLILGEGALLPLVGSANVYCKGEVSSSCRPHFTVGKEEPIDGPGIQRQIAFPLLVLLVRLSTQLWGVPPGYPWSSSFALLW